MEDRIAPATYTVINDANSGTGSLRNALNSAGSGDIINFNTTLTGATGDTIVLATALPTISTNVTITGLGATSLTVSANNLAFRPFTVSAAATAVTISGLTITGGNTTTAGAGISNAGGLTLSNVIVSGNTTTKAGGGIENTGTLTLNTVTVAANTAGTTGGGIDNSGTLTLNTVTVAANTAGTTGGGIETTGANTVTIDEDSIIGETGTLAGNTAASDGGGIWTSSILTLTSSTISGNNGSRGAGIYNKGTLTVESASVVSGNINQAGKNGGGIFDSATSSVTITGSTITNNQGADGGGIFNQANSSATLSDANISDSIITDNTATTDGGGIFNNTGWDTQVTSTTISGNHAVDGGGITNVSTLYLTNVTVGGNTATTTGGGIENTGTLTINSSSVTSNSVTAPANNDGGGGIWNSGALTAIDVTIADNSLSGSVKNSFGSGVEVNAAAATAAFTNSTIAFNQADSNDTSGSSSGALAVIAGSVTLTNTLIASNTAKTGTGPDIYSTSAVASNNSLIGVLTGGSINGNNNQTGVSALLGPLQNYGGSTDTIPLLPGSPAINAGTATGAPTTDQRGVARVGGVDIGAFESSGFTLTVSGGSNQGTLINTNFFTALTVTVTANGSGEPVAGGVITFTSPASGPSTTPIVVTATITAAGTASTTVQANATAGGPYTVTASASGSTSASFSLTNLIPLTFSPSTLAAATVGVAYSQTFTISGGTAPYHNFRITAGALPAGLSLSTTGVLSGTPTAGGSFSFTVSVTDSSSGYGPYTGSQSFSLTVNPPNIVLNPATLAAATVGVAYSQTFTVSGGTPPYSSYQVTAGALPAGLSFTTAGVLSGTPTAGGSFTFTISVTDSSTGTGPYTLRQSYSLTVNPPTITLSPATLVQATVGVAYSQTFTVSGGTPTYYYQITTGALPAGLSLSTAGVLSGTPTAGGSFNFTVSVTDSSTGTGPYTQSQSYALTVNPPTLTLNPATLAAATVGVAYSQTFTVSGGTPAYHYQITTGALPVGLSLSAAGVLSGIPTIIGSFGFTVTVSDSSSGTGPFSVSRTYSLDVTRLLAPPVIVTGQDAGGESQANVYSTTGQLNSLESPLGNSLVGARVAVGDLLGNGVNDLIVGAGPGAGSQVTVYDGSTGQVLYSFYAFPGTTFSSATASAGSSAQVFTFTGGVYVAAGDLFGTGYDDIIVGAGPGGGPQVEVFDGKTGALVSSFYAFSPRFTGGVRVAAGDLFGNAKEEIIAAAGPGGGPQITVWDGLGQTLFASFDAFSANFTGGVYVAAGDVYGIGRDDIITGAGVGGGPQVSIFDGPSDDLLASFYAFSPNFTGGVRVGVTAAYRKAEIVLGAGPGGAPQVETFDAETMAVLGSFFAYDPHFTGGVFVG